MNSIPNILLTNENFVRTITFIDNNMPSKYLLSAIRQAQEVELQTIIGTSMLNKLKTLIANGTISNQENEKYKELLDECQMFLAYQTVTHLCLITNVKISAGGLQMTSDENLTVLNLNDTFVYQQHIQTQADFFASRLQAYVLDNWKTLPEISENKCNEIRATLNSAASTSLWLGGARGRGRYNKFGVNYLYK